MLWACIFYVGSGDPNSGPQACTENTLWYEPSQCQKHAATPTLKTEGYFKNQSPMKIQSNREHWMRRQTRVMESSCYSKFQNCLLFAVGPSFCPGFTQQSVSLKFASSKCQSQNGKFCVWCEETKRHIVQITLLPTLPSTLPPKEMYTFKEMAVKISMAFLRNWKGKLRICIETQRPQRASSPEPKQQSCRHQAI